MKLFAKSGTNSFKIIFAMGALLGAVCFIGVYGVRVLDFTNVGWLFYGENDLRQHYIAWCHFRSDPWHFPIGLIDSLSYPNSVSVIYSDSIPLFAVIFKLFKNLLPVEFQYFGLFGILSFCLMGGFSSVLLAKFTDNPLFILMGSVFYIISFPVIFRMFMHTALASQWIIIAALVLWVYDEKIKTDLNRCIYWGVLGFLCVAIHSYFLPMCGMVLLALMIKQIKGAMLFSAIKEFAAFCLAGLFNLYLLGGFYGTASGYGEGLGTFGSNLNTFVNNIGLGRILPTFSMYYDFQYEGMAYLGIGVLLLLVISAVAMFVFKRRKITVIQDSYDRLDLWLALLVAALSVFFAVMPFVSVGSIKIVHFPYPGFAEKLLGIFRSNGRLIWPAFYVILTAACALTAKIFEKKKGLCAAVFAAAIILQIFDMSATLKEKYMYFNFDFPVITMWDDEEASKMCEGKDEFVFLYTDNDITLLTAYYGYLHNMRQNNYYFARDIEESVKVQIEKYYEELDENILREDCVYIIQEDEFLNRREYYENLDAEFKFIDGHVVFIYKTNA